MKGLRLIIPAGHAGQTIGDRETLPALPPEVWERFVARYFFDMRDGDEILADEEAIELPTIHAVQDEAARSLAELARDEVLLAGNGAARDMAIEVCQRGASWLGRT
jgi:uncharacterized protein DUF6894